MDITSYILGRIKGSGGAGALKYLVVDELPTVGEDATIYLVPKTTTKTNNYYDEYMYIEENWELIGDTQIDLTDYLKEEDLKTINGNSIVGSGDLKVGNKNIVLITDEITPNSTYGVKNKGNEEKLEELYANYDKLEEYNVYLLYANTSAGGVPYNYWKAEKILKSYNTLEFYFNTTDSGYTYVNGTNRREVKLYRLKVVFNDTTGKLSNYQIGERISFYTPYDWDNFIGTTNTRAYTPTGDYNPATKKYVDDNIQITQYSTLPTASADNLGKIAQYTGTTTQDYTNGYFYQCVSDGQDPATYSWENISVQEGGGSSGENIILETSSAGGYTGNDFNTQDNIQKMQYIYDNYNKGENFTGHLLIGNPRFDMYYEASYIGFSLKNGTNYIEFTDGTIKQNSGMYSNHFYKLSISISNDIVQSITVNSRQEYYLMTLPPNNILDKTNTTSYTPTNDYNPATKKYVDDSIASAITTALQGNY